MVSISTSRITIAKCKDFAIKLRVGFIVLPGVLFIFSFEGIRGLRKPVFRAAE